MKKILVSLLVFSLMLSGCGKVESKKEQTVSEKNYSRPEENVELLFKEDEEYIQLNEQEDLIAYKEVEENNLEELFDSITKAIQDHKEVILAVSLGVIIVAGSAYVITNPAIVPSVMTYFNTLMENEAAKEVISVIAASGVKSLCSYLRTQDLEKSLKKGADYALNKLENILPSMLLQ